MLPRTYDTQNCSLARTLEIVGERWTLLILRDAFLGIRRFDEFQARLDVSRTVLAGRLDRLVDQGILMRDRYQQRPDRYEYVLTQKGLDLWPALNALRAWGDSYASADGVPREFVHATCKHDIAAAAYCTYCETTVDATDVLTRPGPGRRRVGTQSSSEPTRSRPRRTRLLDRASTR
jgi:DNA-binding HxlR family transcriptional regulator